MSSRRNAAAHKMLCRSEVEVLDKAEQLFHHTVHWTGTAYFWIIPWFATVMSTCFAEGEPSRSSNHFPDPSMRQIFLGGPSICHRREARSAPMTVR